MDNCEVIFQSPDRSNIYLSTVKLPNVRRLWFDYLESDVTEVIDEGIHVQRRLFFCRSIEVACQLFEFYKDKLITADKYLAKTDLTDEPANRLIAMYHSQSPKSVKLAVYASLRDLHGVVRRVFATQSLGN